VMQTVGKTHKSGCRLQIDVGEDRDPGLTELGRRCTTKRESVFGLNDRCVFLFSILLIGQRFW